MIEKNAVLEDLRRTGGQYALSNRYRHPTLMQFLTRSSTGENFFDLEKTADVLLDTLSFVEDCGRKGAVILFVSTRRESMDLLESVAEKLSMPHVFGRWIGGTLSNFSNIQTRVARMETLINDRDSGKWEKYTKKERVFLDRELRKLQTFFSGIASLKQLPDVVFLLDARKNESIVAEASRSGIPVISLSNADADISKTKHNILSNINSRENISYIMGLVQEAYLNGAKKKVEKEEKMEKEEK